MSKNQKNRFWIKIIIVCVVFGFFTGITGAEVQQPPNIPMVLFGNVTISGEPAPIGTVVSAKEGGKVVGILNVESSGIYGEKPNARLPVSAKENGNPVDLYVNGIKVKTVTYQAGEMLNIDLKASTAGTGSGTPSSTPGGSSSSGGSAVSGSSGGSGGSTGGGVSHGSQSKGNEKTDSDTGNDNQVISKPTQASVQREAKQDESNPYLIPAVIVMIIGLLIGAMKMRKI